MTKIAVTIKVPRRSKRWYLMYPMYDQDGKKLTFRERMILECGVQFGRESARLEEEIEGDPALRKAGL